jgi:hypothetical protein
MEWIDVNDGLPEEGLEVLCAITKHGARTVNRKYVDPVIDKDGKEWYRVGNQVQYELLWIENGKWANWDDEDWEGRRNQDRLTVIAWANRLDYKLKEA